MKMINSENLIQAISTFLIASAACTASIISVTNAKEVDITSIYVLVLALLSQLLSTFLFARDFSKNIILTSHKCITFIIAIIIIVVALYLGKTNNMIGFDMIGITVMFLTLFMWLPKQKDIK